MKSKKLDLNFFSQKDVLAVARKLLGKKLCTRIDGSIQTAGLIIEAEAYGGVSDKASHAYGGRKTDRTEVMYRAGGVAYVYLCYGLHHLFNVVTNQEGTPEAVLIRALLPADGLDLMARRRGAESGGKQLTAGPGMVCEALGIDLRHTGLDLTGETIWLEDAPDILPEKIEAVPRVGVGYAGTDALRPWRFMLHHQKYHSL